MADFNSDFRDLLDVITPSITGKIREHNWVSFTNGYYEHKNDTYMQGFRCGTKSFPSVLVLKYNFPWHFEEHYGKRTESANYFTSKLGGGRLVFKQTFNFELLVDPFFFQSTKLNGFVAQEDEFLNIPSEKFSLDLTDKRSFKTFNKAEIQRVVKWVNSSIPVMLKRIEDASSLQVERRFDEIFAADKQVALKYIPDELKSIFLMNYEG